MLPPCRLTAWRRAATLGIVVGRWLARQPRSPAPAALHPLRWLGRHSLAIYLLHQPILIGFLLLLGFRPMR